MKTRFYSAALVGALALAVAPQARAWDSTGHMIVTTIAWQRLDPAVKRLVTRLAAQVHATKKGKALSYNPITLGSWMDDFKHPKKGVNVKADWHFVMFDCPSNGVPPPLPDSSGAAKNAVWALNTYIPVLGHPDPAIADPQSSILGYVDHIVADIHQPLHALARLERGHGFPVTSVPDLKKKDRHLHEFWDEAYRFDSRKGKIVALWPADRLKNRDAAHLALIRRIAAGIVQRHPESSFPEAGKGGPEQWARESNAIACRMWPASLPHKLPASYVHSVHFIAERRLALAGYRLAHVLNIQLGPMAKGN